MIENKICEEILMRRLMLMEFDWVGELMPCFQKDHTAGGGGRKGD